MTTLLDQAAAAAPQECCGLLLGAGLVADAVQIAANIADDPTRHFEIDPAELFAAHRAARKGGPQLIGYYHSHPNGHPLPSAVDCAHAGGDGLVWAIIAGGEVRFFRDTAQGFVALSFGMIDR